MIPVREQFAAAVARVGGARKASEILDCTPAYIYLLMADSSEKLPSVKMAAAIEDKLGVPMRAWAASLPVDDDKQAAGGEVEPAQKAS